jgi:hypothetical protein
MADNNLNPKFVFVSGVPGSSWSMISHRLKLVKDLDCSDVTDDRQFLLPVNMSTTAEDIGNRTGNRIAEGDKSHFGCYFGPHNEFGDGFDNIPANYTLDQFYQECARPFENNEKAKCVRSHWFSYNLDWIWDNCKGHDFFLMYKETEIARDWWLERGGWDIHHPVYTWYKDTERLTAQIEIENNNLLEFTKRKGLEWKPYNEEWWQEEFGKKEKTYRFRPPVKEYLDKIFVIYTTIP